MAELIYRKNQVKATGGRADVTRIIEFRYALDELIEEKSPLFFRDMVPLLKKALSLSGVRVVKENRRELIRSAIERTPGGFVTPEEKGVYLDIFQLSPIRY